MELNFDYYHNLEEVEISLLNPDDSELKNIVAFNKKFTPRFNDLSELSFSVRDRATNSRGETIKLEVYDEIETKRLIRVSGIGDFQITKVVEESDGQEKFKDITAYSSQVTFDDKGIVTEERVYCLYNPADPMDDRYDPKNIADIPSVVGQAYKQMGILQDLSQGKNEPLEPYEEWTITYINDALKYDKSSDNNILRSFADSKELGGYSWLARGVEEAFGVIVYFDFRFKCIQIMFPEELTFESGVVCSFANFMNHISVQENGDDIVTVLKCSGTNCDISEVNPMGTDYICDFSYYMEHPNDKYKWMSKALVDKLTEWQTLMESKKSTYRTNVQALKQQYKVLTDGKNALTSNSVILQDLQNAFTHREEAQENEIAGGTLIGIVTAESVEVQTKSLEVTSKYFQTPFKGSEIVKAYHAAPTYSTEQKTWSWTAADESNTITDTADNIIKKNLSISEDKQCWYFQESTLHDNYCKLFASIESNKEFAGEQHVCQGFKRYIGYCQPEKLEKGGKRYVDPLQKWISLRSSKIEELRKGTIEPVTEEIARIKNVLKGITEQVNILSYFRPFPSLYRELSKYWVEGQYTNDNITIYDNMPEAEKITLEIQLMDSGEKEITKINHPKYSFEVSANDLSQNYDLRSQMRGLNLGSIVAVEKEDGIWYYPLLMGMSIDLDNHEGLELMFVSGSKLDSWEYNYAELITHSAETTRQVNASWQNLIQYSKDKQGIESIIKNPLDTTLRAASANLSNQSFIVDNNGILGRKKAKNEQDIFDAEQMRILNNVLLFTDDNWATAKTALGKLYFEDGQGNTRTSYGLIAETIIGSLIMGDTLYVTNNNNTISLTKDGITIKNGESVVFQATTDGTVTISGTITDEALNDFINNTYTPAIDGINNKITGLEDDKIETYYQAGDPSGDWTAEQYPNHVGDLWYDTTNKLNKRWAKVKLDPVTYGWEIMEEAVPQEVYDKIDKKAQIFVSQPVPPYDIGDLWTAGSTGDIKKCKQKKIAGESFDESDWDLASKYTDDSALTTFISGTYATDKATIKGQVDSKIQTWYQASKPSTSWTDEEKTAHIGDLWYNTATDADKNKTYRWDGTNWQEQNVSQSVFDTIDGKSQLFVTAKTETGETLPTPPYNVGDLWVTDPNGELKRCTTAKSKDQAAAEEDWVKATYYTDDSALTTFIGTYTTTIEGINGKITGLEDSKIETYYQASDPSGKWEESDYPNHVGDLWYDTTNKLNKRWAKTSENPVKYNWEIMEEAVPTEVYDKIDEKAQIFVAEPTPPYNVGDLWVEGSTGDIKKCKTAKSSDGTYDSADWDLASKYTDDSALTSFLGTYTGTMEDAVGLIDGKAETFYQEKDPSEDWKTAESKKAHIGDLWYNTLDGANTTSRWDGAAWQPQDAPKTVFDKIDGKSTIFFSDTEPISGMNDGDCWVDTSTSDIMKKKILRYQESTKAWVDAAVYAGEGIFTKGTTTIDGGKITTGTITASKIEAKSITSAQIAAGTITGSEIAAHTIKTSELATDAIKSNNYVAGGTTAEVYRQSTDPSKDSSGHYKPGWQVTPGTSTHEGAIWEDTSMTPPYTVRQWRVTPGHVYDWVTYSGPIPEGTSHYSSSGTYLDLETGVFESQNFGIDSNGDAFFKGTINGGLIKGENNKYDQNDNLVGGMEINLRAGVITARNNDTITQIDGLRGRLRTDKILVKGGKIGAFNVGVEENQSLSTDYLKLAYDSISFYTNKEDTDPVILKRGVSLPGPGYVPQILSVNGTLQVDKNIIIGEDIAVIANGITYNTSQVKGPIELKGNVGGQLKTLTFVNGILVSVT